MGTLSRSSFSVEQTATGARVQRVLELGLGQVPASKYGEVKRVFDAYRDARQVVLVFEKEK